SFTLAAQELHVAQPAVSQQVRRLERELGVELLSRTTRRVLVTEAAELALARAGRILADADAPRAATDEPHALPRRTLPPRGARARGGARSGGRQRARLVRVERGRDDPRAHRSGAGGFRAASLVCGQSWPGPRRDFDRAQAAPNTDLRAVPRGPAAPAGRGGLP